MGLRAKEELSMRTGFCLLVTVLVVGWSAAVADQIVVDAATDGLPASDCQHQWVDEAANASRSVLVYSNSWDPLDPYKKTRIGNQCGINGDASDLQTALGLNTYGIGVQLEGTTNNAAADDFLLCQDTLIEELVFYLYETGATATTITRLDYAFMTTDPLGQLPPAFTTATTPPVTFTNVYRKQTSDADTAACTRRFQRVSVVLSPPVALTAGRYWLTWKATGSTSYTGPWQSPVVFPGLVNKPGANGLQSANGAAYARYYDTGGTPPPPPPGYPQDFQFEIYGTITGTIPEGACCLPSGDCTVLTSACCAERGGVYAGDLTACDLTSCPEGACCLPVGTCTVTTLVACNAVSGIYQGDLTVCDPNPCPPPSGACCFTDGTCTYVMQADCTGTWLGPGISCTPNPCPPPGGNCANPLVIDFATLPHIEANTTCGKGNDYANTCLGTYDAGEDTIYTLLVPEPMCVTIVLAGVDITDVSIALAIDEVCPLGSGTNDCMFKANNTGNGAGLIFRRIDLPAGVYTMQIDNDNSPTCFEYYLWIYECTGACCLPNGDCLAGAASEAECTLAGGTFLGPDTTCDTFMNAYTVQTCTNAFEDIQPVGTPISLLDDSGIVVPIGFRFDYFGQGYAHVAICSNGYLTFSTTLTDLSPDPFPTATVPNDVIGPFWRDLNPSDPNAPGQWIGFATLGNPPNRRFVAEWYNVSQYATPANRNTFEAILYEGTNCVEFRYGTLMTPFEAARPKCGIENSTGTVGYDVTTTVQGGATCVSLCPTQEPICEPILCPGDADCDGDVDFYDIDPFVAKLGCPAIDPVACSIPCPWENCDADSDGDVDFFDIDPFVALLGTICP
jgi:hypothetical protein